MGFSIINQPFSGTPMAMEPPSDLAFTASVALDAAAVVPCQMELSYVMVPKLVTCEYPPFFFGNHQMMGHDAKESDHDDHSYNFQSGVASWTLKTVKTP